MTDPPITYSKLTPDQTHVTAKFHSDSGANVSVSPDGEGTFTVQVSYPAGNASTASSPTSGSLRTRSVNRKAWRFLTTAIVFAAVLAMVIVSMVIVSQLSKGGSAGTLSQPELTQPILIISGVLVLLVTLALTAVVFSSLDLSDRTQALGLPEGSIRSVIALSLVLLFAILAVYLYSSLASSGKIVTAAALNQEARMLLKQSLLPGQFLFDQPSADGASFNVYFRQAANPASEDFAKQLLAMLGTLVTAVASFYFGSKAASPGQAITSDLSQSNAKNPTENPSPTA